MSIIEDFYYGNIIPCENFFENGSEYSRLLTIASNREAEISSYLDDEQKPLLSQLNDAQLQLLSLEAKDGFINGWRLGIRFLADSFK